MTRKLTTDQARHIANAADASQMHQVAKNITLNTSQSLRLQPELRINRSEVLTHHNPARNDVVLSPTPRDWQGLLDAVALSKDEELWFERRQSHVRRDARNQT